MNKLSVLIAFSFIFCIIYIFTNRIPELFIFGYELMEFGYALAVSLIAAGIFYYFQIHVPTRNYIKRFKTIIASYQQEILSIIIDVAYQHMIDNRQFDSKGIDQEIKCGLKKVDNLLLTNGEYIYKLKKDLTHHERFKEFFRLEAGQGQRMWERFKNGIEENSYQRKQLLILLDLMQQITKELMSKIDLDEFRYKYLHDLAESIHWLQKIDFNQEDAKPLFEFLWELFTGENFWRDLDPSYSLLNKISKL